MGVGNSIAERQVGDQTGPSSLIRINPKTGASRPYASGLSMGNGVDRGPDGSFYASNDFGSNIDRIRNGQTERGWAKVESGNGLQVDSTGKWLYVAQTFRPAAIQRVEIANPQNVTPFAVAPPEDSGGGLRRDGPRRGGQPVRRRQRRRARSGRSRPRARCACCCAACRRSPTGPSAVTVGVHGSAFPPENLYVVAFNGDVTEIEGVVEPGASAEAPAPDRAARDGRRRADALQGVRHGERPAGRGRGGAAGGPRGADQPARERQADAEVQAPGQAAGAAPRRRGYRRDAQDDPRRPAADAAVLRPGRDRALIFRAMARLFALALLIAAVATTTASAHLERPSYWPDPTPDTSVTPPAGGEVPKARSLASAVTGQGPGRGARGLPEELARRARSRSITEARRTGLPPAPEPAGDAATARRRPRKMTQDQPRARQGSASYRSIQAAVNDSGNNDRVVIMPGRYTEPKSRKAPLNDPKCNPSMLQETQSGALTPSYEYQATCPNDQNLIHVTGPRGRRASRLPEPRPDRHGIPEQELGECIRCNLQIEGSGAKPEDVILDAGKGYENPKDPTARPGGDMPAAECHTDANEENPCWAKHVVLRTDRSDGFVGRNFLMRGAREHGFYTEETDGVLLDRVKFFWNADYGHLSFTTDHNVVQNCDGFGSGDAVVYPGAVAADRRVPRRELLPRAALQHGRSAAATCTAPPWATRARWATPCASRRTTSTATRTASRRTRSRPAGHPGFPADGMKIDHNWFYANNLDIYREDNPFEALVPQPVGTGFLWAGQQRRQLLGQLGLRQLAPGHDAGRDPRRRRGHARRARSDSQTQCPTSDGDGLLDLVREPVLRQPHGPGAARLRAAPGARDVRQRDDARRQREDRPQRRRLLVGRGHRRTPATAGTTTRGRTARATASRRTRRSAPPRASRCPGSCRRTAPTSMGSAGGYSSKAPGLLACYGQWETDNVDAPGCSWWDTPPQPGSAAAASQRRAEDRLEPSQALRDWVMTSRARSRTAGRLRCGRRLAGAALLLLIALAGCGSDDGDGYGRGRRAAGRCRRHLGDRACRPDGGRLRRGARHVP